jgi:hypothetical protein
MSYNGKTHRIGAGLEVMLSLGAIHTSKVLMQSGIGDQAESCCFLPRIHPNERSSRSGKNRTRSS